jgi:hypothetical protein
VLHLDHGVLRLPVHGILALRSLAGHHFL